MLLIGIVSLIPGIEGSAVSLPALTLDTSYGLFLGLFAMNIVNKVALILFGVAGIAVASMKFNSLPRSITWSRTVAIVMGIAAILGFIPQTNTFFGYWPLFGFEALAHAAFAIVGAYFGFALTHKANEEIKRDPNLRATFQGGH